MDESIRIIHELNVDAWRRLSESLENVSVEEGDWRPVPEANSISVIVRHLRIEAAWHVDSLRDGSPMPTIAVPVDERAIDVIPFDLEANARALADHQTRYLELLRAATLATLIERTRKAYGDFPLSEDQSCFIAYHNAVHLNLHCGQIRMLRNLFRKTRGQQALFVPDNPTYPGHR